MIDDGIELGHSLGAVGDVEFFEHALHVIFDGEGADVQDGADFGIGLALGHPVEDLQFAVGEVVLLDQFWTTLVSAVSVGAEPAPTAAFDRVTWCGRC